MTLREQLLEPRFGIGNVKEILFYVNGHKERKEQLVSYLFEGDTRLSYRACWVMTHLPYRGNEEWFPACNRLADYLLCCTHTGICRMLLSLLLEQPLEGEPRVDLLNYCLEEMLSPFQPAGVRTQTLKLGYRLSLSHPELKQEFLCMMEMMEENNLPPSMKAAKRNILILEKRARKRAPYKRLS